MPAAAAVTAWELKPCECLGHDQEQEIHAA
jgi:hypothetical protein